MGSTCSRPIQRHQTVYQQENNFNPIKRCKPVVVMNPVSIPWDSPPPAMQRPVPLKLKLDKLQAGNLKRFLEPRAIQLSSPLRLSSEHIQITQYAQIVLYIWLVTTSLWLCNKNKEIKEIFLAELLECIVYFLSAKSGLWGITVFYLCYSLLVFK